MKHVKLLEHFVNEAKVISTSALKKEIEEACDYLENTSDISQQTIDFIRKMGPQMIDFTSKYQKF